jgi:hypothetical protein
MPRTSAVHAVTTLGIDMGKDALHMIGLDTGIARGLPARADLVLRFGLEVAGIMSLAIVLQAARWCRLIIRPCLTAGRSPISFVQRVRFLYSCVRRNVRGSL